MLPPTLYYCENCYIFVGEDKHDYRPNGEICDCGGTYVNLYPEYNYITQVSTAGKYTFIEILEKRKQYIRQHKLKRILK